MRVAALMPTRDRAATAARAAGTFLAALHATGLATSVTLAVADDSGEAGERAALAALMTAIAEQYPSASINIVATGRGGERRNETHGGPGAARNHALALLRKAAPAADLTVMFDDDVCFADVSYRGLELRCDGRRLLEQALRACAEGPTVAGCGYSGRQDLSILEHARLMPGQTADAWHVAPSTERGGVENVSPGGISTAFLAIGAAPAELPDFPEHYNEDYVWLHALAEAGWNLRRVPAALAHAPPGEVEVTEVSLAFQIHGEIVWLAVLERERFPAEDPESMAAAVEEIAGDLRAALADPAVSAQPRMARTVEVVLRRYERIGGEFLRRQPGAHAVALLADIHAALRLAAFAGT